MTARIHSILYAYPLGIPALCLAVGIGVGDLISWPFFAVWGVAFACLLLAAWDRHARWALPLLVLMVGVVRVRLEVEPLAAEDLRRIAPQESSIVAVRGYLEETPIVKQRESNGKVSEHATCRLRLRALRLPTGTWLPALGTLNVSCRGRPPSLFKAQSEVQLEGLLRTPPPAAFPGTFDYANYLQRNRVYYELNNEAPKDWVSLDETPVEPSLSDRFQAWGKATLLRDLPVEDAMVHLLWAMVLGWKGGVDEDLQEAFMRSGTIHVFAISGLHIALIAGICIQALMFFGVPRELAGIASLPLIWAYTGITGWQASAIRSAAMMSVVVVGWALRRPGQLINSLAASAILVLLWDPQQLFQGGFQLSFLVVFSLATLGPRLQSLVESVVLPQTLLPESHRTFWSRSQDWLLRSLVQSVSVAAAAWLGSLPLVMHLFHMFNPISLLANLIVVPLSSIALASAVGSLVCGDWWPALGALFNHGSWFWMKGMVFFSRVASSCPGGCWNCPSLGWSGAMAYYLGLALWVGYPAWSLPWRRRLAAATLSAGCAWCVSGALAMSRSTLFVLPRAGGASLWVEEAWFGDRWLIDPGSERVVRQGVIPFLRGRGLNHLENLVLSQGNTQAAGGVDLVQAVFPTRRRFLAQTRYRSGTIQRWLNDAEGASLGVERLQAGDHLGNWVVLHPQGDGKTRSAEDSPLVLKFFWGDKRLLWLPPLNLAGQEALLRATWDLKAEILIAGIPLQDRPLYPELLEAIKPSYLVLIDDATPKGRRQVEGQLSRLKRSGCRLIRTSESGPLTLEFSGTQLRFRLSTDPKADRVYPLESGPEGVPRFN